jgi:phage protein U
MYGEMLSVGPYLFSLQTAAYTEMTRKWEWRWEEVKRLGTDVANQYLGPGSIELSFKGTIYTEFPGDGRTTGTEQIDALRNLADQGVPMMVIDGRGKVYGRYVLTSLEETGSFFHVHGAPKKQEFSVEMKGYGGDRNMFGYNFSGGFNIAAAALSTFSNLGGVLIEAGAGRVTELLGDFSAFED